MESTNLHHHHHHQIQDHQLVGSSPSNCYGVDIAPNTILSPSNIGTLIINPNDTTTQQNEYLAPPQSTSITNQNLGFNWANNNITGSFSNQLGHDLHLARIKGEFSNSYQKFTEMLQSSPSSIEELHFNPFIKNEQGDQLGDLSEKLLLRNFSSNCQINGVPFPATGDLYTYLGNEITPSRGNFSQIFPTINVSNLTRSSNSASSSSLDANMQALDLLNSGRFVDDHSFYKDSFSNYGLDHMQQLTHRPSNSLNKVTPFTNGNTEAKRRSTSLEPKVPPKKSRSEPRTSCPPFKVRKEKLGDRIAALQQLVAPFGKTDTASVLMEAIGYIKFLQNQVETLSVPYMKSSRNKNNRTMMRGKNQSLSEDGSEETRRDLRSRGLCLVPLSCLSYVTDGGGGVWPPPNFST